MQHLRITIVQTDLIWASPIQNIGHFTNLLSRHNTPTDLIVLPEMFSTGFNMTPETASETMDGASVHWMKETASRHNAVVCGSILVHDGGVYVNRFIWMRPDGSFSWSDKKHLFRMAGENKVFSPGNRRVVVEAGGFRFLLLVCYDLRFPVWSRNTYKEGTYEYDAIIYTANWPASRSHVWKTLLMARAMENQAYVIGVNRIGKDLNGTAHNGDSCIVSPKGELICQAPQAEEAILTAEISKTELDTYRKSFLNAEDWDAFVLK